jgi:DNA-binding transcriptional regulator PaaX
MRKATTIRFLKTVDKGHYSSAFEAFLFSCGSVSLLKQNMRNIGWSSSLDDEEKRARQRFRVMMHRLRKDGLISYERNWLQTRVTQKARALLLGSFGKDPAVFPKAQYAKKESGVVTLVLFDIPERYRRERNWLRGALRGLDFELLQRSVWIGKTIIPKQFLQDIRDAHINQYVEIVSIAKSGTIQKINAR